jgi:hypothetical protein
MVLRKIATGNTRLASLALLVISSFVPVILQDARGAHADPWFTWANLASITWLALCFSFLRANALKPLWILGFGLVALFPFLLTVYFFLAFRLGGFAP